MRAAAPNAQDMTSRRGSRNHPLSEAEKQRNTTKVRVRSHDRKGREHEGEYQDVLAVCIQHEMDHLEGKLFVDYLSDLKRERIRKKLEKERRERGSRPAANATGARRAY